MNYNAKDDNNNTCISCVLMVLSIFAYGQGRSTTNHCRMRLGHLRSHLFNHNLINTPFCENEVCDHVAETPSDYLLKCPKFANERRVMLSEISEIVFPGINHNI